MISVNWLYVRDSIRESHKNNFLKCDCCGLWVTKIIGIKAHLHDEAPGWTTNEVLARFNKEEKVRSLYYYELF